GIGATTLDRVVAWAKANDVSPYDALSSVEQIGDLGSAARKKLASFRELLSRVRTAAEELLPSELLAQVLADIGYVAALEKEDTAQADARIENLRELVGSMRDYEAEAGAAGGEPSLLGFLERVTIASGVDGVEEGGRVVLMTVHSAKGVEFERVLLTGMEEEMFPYKGIDPAEREELEEERRLAYVAITRARRQLFMIHTRTRQIFGTTRWNRPSRFLTELPPEAAEHTATRAASAEAVGARFIDRPSWNDKGRYVDREEESEPRFRKWRHPQTSSQASLQPGDRYVDRDGIDSAPGESTKLPLRRGARVKHDRFGEGRVVSVVSAGE